MRAFPFPWPSSRSSLYNQLHDAGWNHCLTVAFQNELIPSDPTLGVKRFSGKAIKIRGVLTVEEAQRLFELPWDDERFQKTGNMLLIV
jgi:hypothetical protein